MEAGVIGSQVIVAITFVLFTVLLVRTLKVLSKLEGQINESAEPSAVPVVVNVPNPATKPAVAEAVASEVERAAPTRERRTRTTTAKGNTATRKTRQVKAKQPSGNGTTAVRTNPRTAAIESLPTALRTHFRSMPKTIQQVIPTSQIAGATKRSDFLIQNEINVLRITDENNVKEYSEVADVLGIQPNTVQTYLWSAKAKLGAANLEDAKAKLDAGV